MLAGLNLLASSDFYIVPNTTMNELTVYDLKQILQNALDSLEDYSDESLVNVHSSTYLLYGDFISLAWKWFVSLDEPVENEEEDY